MSDLQHSRLISIGEEIGALATKLRKVEENYNIKLAGVSKKVTAIRTDCAELRESVVTLQKGYQGTTDEVGQVFDQALNQERHRHNKELNTLWQGNTDLAERNKELEVERVDTVTLLSNQVSNLRAAQYEMKNEVFTITQKDLQTLRTMSEQVDRASKAARNELEAVRARVPLLEEQLRASDDRTLELEKAAVDHQQFQLDTKEHIRKLCDHVVKSDNTSRSLSVQNKKLKKELASLRDAVVQLKREREQTNHDTENLENRQFNKKVRSVVPLKADATSVFNADFVVDF